MKEERKKSSRPETGNQAREHVTKQKRKQAKKQA